MRDKEHDEPFPGIPLGDGLYQMTDEDMKEAILFRPGMPNFDSSDNVTAPSELITVDTVLKPVDVIIFYDDLSRNPVDGGYNQWAFVVDDQQALFSRLFVHSIKLRDLRKNLNAVVIRRIPEGLAPMIANFLLRHRWRPALFKAAINFLQCTNYMPFIEGQFFPDDVSYDTDDQYERAWQRMVASLQPHDPIFTFDRTSHLSKLIAMVTHGPFSHVATYKEDGNIWEIVTSGARIVPLDTYKDRHRYRVAAYRHLGFEPTSREQQAAEMNADVGNVKYGYLGALGAGIKSYFGMHREAASPNGLILSGPLVFIAQA